MNIGIYKIVSPSGKVYIGQSVDIRQRKYQYKSACKYKNKTQLGPKLYNSFIKYGWELHIFEVIEECTIELLKERETFHKQQHINEFGWKTALFCEIYDLGGGPKSDAIKIKISNSNKGKNISEETKNRMRQSHLGLKHNVVVKGKDHGLFGKPKSKQHVENMMKNREVVIEATIRLLSKPVIQYDLQGNFIKEWPSITAAKTFIKGDVNAVLYGKSKTAGGFKWKYK